MKKLVFHSLGQILSINTRLLALLVDGKILASKPLCHASFWYQDKLYQVQGFHNKVLFYLDLALAGPGIIFFDGSAEKKAESKGQKNSLKKTSTQKNTGLGLAEISKQNYFRLKMYVSFDLLDNLSFVQAQKVNKLLSVENGSLKGTK